MKELFPHARVVHIEEVNPAANRSQPGAQEIWARAVRQHMGRNPDYVFASETYGWDFAKALKSRFIPVDPSRDQFPISGTELRSRPFRHWHYLPDVVRPHFVRQLMIKVPELTVIASEEIIRKAALLLNTLYVPVYSHFYQGFDDSSQHILDDGTRALAQQALITALKSQARCFLLRSGHETVGLLTDEGAPDLVISLDFSGSSQDHTPAEPAVSKTIRLACSPKTAAQAIRDLAIDRYKDWF